MTRVPCSIPFPSSTSSVLDAIQLVVDPPDQVICKALFPVRCVNFVVQDEDTYLEILSLKRPCQPRLGIDRRLPSFPFRIVEKFVVGFDYRLGDDITSMHVSRSIIRN